MIQKNVHSLYFHQLQLFHFFYLPQSVRCVPLQSYGSFLKKTFYKPYRTNPSSTSLKHRSDLLRSHILCTSKSTSLEIAQTLIHKENRDQKDNIGVVQT